MHIVKLTARLLMALCLASIMPALLSGCWSKQELNDRSFVSTMIIDMNKEGETEVSTLFLLPNRISTGLESNAPGQKPYVLVTGKGRNVAEAFHKLQRDLPRNVTWGQMSVIIIGDRYARAGLAPLFDFLIRSTEFRLRVNVFYFKGVARNLSKLAPIFERFPTEIWRETTHTKRIPPIQIRDLLYAYWNNLGDGYMPELVLRMNNLLTENKKMPWSGIGGAALIKNGKVTDRFTDEETEGILVLTNDVDELLVTAQMPDDEELVSARLIDIRRKVKAVRRGNQVEIPISVTAEADLVSIHSSLDLSNPSNLRKIERALQERLQEKIHAAVDRARRRRADVFQWSEYIKYKYPSLWRQWSERLRENLVENVKPEIDVRIHLRNTGVSRSNKS
ncbi:Spore germination protein A3 [Paenibacillus plantiphilus]|uniref:Spore germination protein A3 n=1 Tax=Paenibacillus plantiphilus TaxID=2905650 RepID=A0ABN8GHP5_9BACL|nr:Ger(x)C family spore germination protein [Paenibacillus plantiphilus]CAH1209496.1 Spore germination protein A3 [Paenibacillus plantiphilus]